MPRVPNNIDYIDLVHLIIDKVQQYERNLELSSEINLFYW